MGFLFQVISVLFTGVEAVKMAAKQQKAESRKQKAKSRRQKAEGRRQNLCFFADLYHFPFTLPGDRPLCCMVPSFDLEIP